MCRSLIVKVKTVFFLADFDHTIKGIMLKNELFEVEESFFMLDVLPDLHNCTPGMRSELLLAIVALNVSLNKLSDKSLLDFRLIVQLLLNCYFDFDSF